MRVLTRAAVAGLLLVLIPAVSHTQELAAAVEAEFIERFTRFIEWPADSTVANAAVPFVAGVIGDSPLLGALTELSRRARIKGKTLEVRRLTDVTEIDGCQLVFVSSSERDRVPAIVARAKGRPILTVADSAGAAKRGVMINFTQQDDFIRFEVNPAAAKASKLRLASELLSLGTVVE